MLEYGKMEKDLLTTLNFDLKIYSVFTPLKSALCLIDDYIKDELIYKEIHEEAFKLAEAFF